MPKSSLNIGFTDLGKRKQVTFEMWSSPILDDEVDRIFEEGFSGNIPQKLGISGKGIGLFRTKNLLNKTNADIVVIKNCNKETRNLAGFDYELNRFVVTLF
jgi:hypothetical protein